MKITVYRRNGEEGYTEPVAFLGDKKPQCEGWFVNAKDDLSDSVHPPKLLMLGLAFLIYSMYHAPSRAAWDMQRRILAPTSRNWATTFHSASRMHLG